MERRFDLDEATRVLVQTPHVLDAWLRDLPEAWLRATEGPSTWSAFDVVGHLIHGERTDWIPRVRHLLTHGEAVPFPVFDRFAQFEASRGRSMTQLLDDFRAARAESLDALAGLALTPADLGRTGTHPEFGVVTLAQHLATWVVHDLDHLAQIARVLARGYAGAVGPWRAYLRVVRPPE